MDWHSSLTTKKVFDLLLPCGNKCLYSVHTVGLWMDWEDCDLARSPSVAPGWVNPVNGTLGEENSSYTLRYRSCRCSLCSWNLGGIWNASDFSYWGETVTLSRNWSEASAMQRHGGRDGALVIQGLQILIVLYKIDTTSKNIYFYILRQKYFYL